MKSVRINLLLLAIAGMVIYSACKDKEDKPDPKVIDVLCDGDGSNSYWPLDSGRIWSYTMREYGVADTQVKHFEIHKTVEHVGKRYFVVENPEVSFWGVEMYLRIDSVTHDVMNVNKSSGVEYIEVPGKAELGKKWNYSFWSREITHTDTSVQMDHCKYTGLMEVTEWDGGQVKKKLYYKKGLGLIYQWYPPYNSGDPKIDFKLIDVNFK